MSKDTGRVLTDRAGQASPGAATASPPSGDHPSREPGDFYDDDGFYDDCGRYWPKDAAWCDRCQGMGTEECLCGGDFCCCGVDEVDCRRCGGEGYYIDTPAMKAARLETAQWWAGLHAALEGISSDSDGSPKGGDGTAPSRSDDSAGRQASPEPNRSSETSGDDVGGGR